MLEYATDSITLTVSLHVIFKVSSHHFAPASRQPPQHYLENSALERERRTAAYSWLTTREARDSSRQGRPPARGPTATSATSIASDQPYDRHQQVSQNFSVKQALSSFARTVVTLG